MSPEEQELLIKLKEEMQKDPKMLASELAKVNPKNLEEKRQWLKDHFDPKTSSEPAPQSEVREPSEATSTETPANKEVKVGFGDWIGGVARVTAKGIQRGSREKNVSEPGPGIGLAAKKAVGLFGSQREMTEGEVGKKSAEQRPETEEEQGASFVKKVSSALSRLNQAPGTQGKDAHKEIEYALHKHAEELSPNNAKQQDAIRRAGISALNAGGSAETAGNTMQRVNEVLSRADIPMGNREMWLNAAANVATPEDANLLAANLRQQGYLKEEKK